MDDLISRKTLLDDICKYVNGTPLQEMFETIVDKQPTAYDVDEVVDKLESMDKTPLYEDFDDKEIIDYLLVESEVIEIVKRGGING